MTVNVARRRTRASTRATKRPPAGLPIGDEDQLIFACPACARPLATGAHRCPGCGTRLVMGVAAKRVSVFVGIGLAVGLAVGGGVASLALTADRLTHEEAARSAAAAEAAALAARTTPAPTASLAPIGVPGASPTPSTAPVSVIPGLSRSALTQAIAVDARLAAASRDLAAALAARKFDAFAVSEVLRSLSSDAVNGLSLTPHIADWPDWTKTGSELSSFYSLVQATAGEGLSASIRNEPAYRAAGNSMLKVLAGLAAIDAGARNAATVAGVLPSPASPTP
jgi:hypothetical protein